MFSFAFFHMPICIFYIPREYVYTFLYTFRNVSSFFKLAISQIRFFLLFLNSLCEKCFSFYTK